MRELGWYWVKPDPDDEWECAEWDGRTWNITCTDHEWSEDQISEVGGKVLTPEELASFEKSIAARALRETAAAFRRKMADKGQAGLCAIDASILEAEAERLES